jgi:ATP-dependent RNA helicase RhlE
MFLVTQFTEIGLIPPLLRVLAEENYTTPTPVQSQSIPPLLTGRDLLGVAQTGTGKTAAFALPILQRLHTHGRPTPRRSCRTLVLSPTRELASQIRESFKTYGRYLPFTSTSIFGGVPIGRQIRDIGKGFDIIVATPGRLLDLINQRALTLEAVEILVLDEADQMLDMGFIHDIRKIVGMISVKRQTMLFSATMPREIGELAEKFLRDPVKVEVTPVATTAERVDQRVIFVDTSRKQQLLHVVLADKTIERALVFTRTKHGADKVVRRLDDAGISASAIHGNKSQAQRERALADFKQGRARLLVATDIAARGIDVDAITHVINFELPNVPESYVHRIGRTARAGAEGIAISFCDREERSYLRSIERVTRQKLSVIESPLGEGTGMPFPAEDESSNKPPSRHKPQGRPQQNRSGSVKPGNHARSGRLDAKADGSGAARTEQKDGKRWQSGTRDPMADQRHPARSTENNRRFGR